MNENFFFTNLIHKAKTSSEDSNDINKEFKDLLFSVIETLLGSDRLRIKINNGKQLNGTEYFEYVEKCLMNFQNNSLLVNPSNFNAVVERYMTNSVKICFEFYKENIKSDVDNHDAIREKSFKMYELSHKMGTLTQIRKFKEVLTGQIEDYFQNHEQSIKSYLNEIKTLKNELKSNEQKYVPVVKEKDRQIEQIMKEHKDKLEAKDKEIKQLKRDYATLTDQMREVLANNSTIMDDSKKLTEEVKVSNSKYFVEKSKWVQEKADLEKIIARDCEKFVENSNILNLEIQKLISERNSIYKQYSNVRADLKSAEAWNNELQKNIDNAKSSKQKEINRLTGELKQARDDIFSKNQELNNLKHQLHNANTDINNLNDKNIYLVNDLKNANFHKVEMENSNILKLNLANHKIDDLQKKLDEAKKEIQTLNGNLEEEKYKNQQLVDNLQTQKRKTETQIQNLAEQILEKPTTSQQANSSREYNQNQSKHSFCSCF